MCAPGAGCPAQRRLLTTVHKMGVPAHADGWFAEQRANTGFLVTRGIEQTAVFLAEIAVVRIGGHQLFVRFVLGAELRRRGHNEFVAVDGHPFDFCFETAESVGRAAVREALEARMEMLRRESNRLSDGFGRMVLGRHDFETVQTSIDKGVSGEFVFAEVTVSKIDSAACVGVIAVRARRSRREGDEFAEALRIARTLQPTRPSQEAHCWQRL